MNIKSIHNILLVIIFCYYNSISQNIVHEKTKDTIRNKALDMKAFKLFNSKYKQNKLTDLLSLNTCINHKLWKKYKSEITVKCGGELISYMLTDCIMDTTIHKYSDTSRQGGILYAKARSTFQYLIKRDLSNNIIYIEPSNTYINQIRDFIHPEMQQWPIFVVKGKTMKVIVVLYPDYSKDMYGESIALIELLE